MNKELEDTLRMIIERTGDNNSVFIPMQDFPWFHYRNGQLTKLYEAGYITRPFFCDDGAEITLTKEGRIYFCGDENFNKSEDRQSDKPSVFISYNHKSKAIVEELVEVLDPFADIHWDENVKPWDSFKCFMDTIRKQDHAVMVISDLYLKSKACLYEVVQLMKTEGWDKRAMFIVEDNAKSIFTLDGRLKYIDYWNEEENKLKKEIYVHSTAAIKDISDQISRVKDINYYIGDFMTYVSTVNNPDVPIAIQRIVERVKISAKRNRSNDIENVIRIILEKCEMSTSDLASTLNRSEATIRKYLKSLMDKGVIQRRGTGHNIKYSTIKN